MTIRSIILSTMLVSFNLLAGSAFAESSVWKVSKDNNYFYIGGTIHLLSEQDHPLPAEFDLAYNDAGKIFFETDLAATETPEFQSKFIAAMTYSDDRTLEGELEPAIYRKLENFMTSRQMPIAQFSKFQPWGVSLMIVILEYQRLGMMPNYGVDAYFNGRALSDHKRIMGLETADEQLNFLKSMAGMDPNAGIEYTLRDLKRLPESMAAMKESWRSGDLDALAESAFMLQMQEEFPQIYNTIVTNRNNAWMAQLVRLTEDSAKEFVLVGAMHLYGKEGILNQLALQGFTVEQL
ncbi:TraB/GumN family protein [Marinobacterium sp. D7]|uniref:TraB/GumN family protein n=1 Tax=Marinobacterium ramblicola TaxID=2849041 RepID=UPI001C2DF04A|nr:TraB/GumN family protein [Marinobacterium ramblicola]MBV1789806.1 TraB/GumN family protein [Marinobacterium ramblicola]